MFRSSRTAGPIKLRKIGQQLRKLCRTDPMDGISADEAIALIRAHKNDPEVINAHLFMQFTPVLEAYLNDKPLNRMIVEELLTTSCVDVSRKYYSGETLLQLAVIRGHNNIAEMLLKKSTNDINAKDNIALTALMFAAQYGRVELAKRLLQFDHLELNALDRKGRPALFYAAENCPEIVDLLLDKPGIDAGIEAKDKSGKPYNAMTILMQRELKNHNGTELIRKLVRLPGVNLNIRSCLSDKGFTPLMEAADSSLHEVARILLDAGADPMLHDSEGRNAAEIAHGRGNPSMEQIIRTAMDKINLWNHRKNTILSRAQIALHLHGKGFPKEIAAMVTKQVLVNPDNGSALDAVDKNLFDLHNQQIVNNAFNMVCNMS